MGPHGLDRAAAVNEDLHRAPERTTDNSPSGPGRAARQRAKPPRAGAVHRDADRPGTGRDHRRRVERRERDDLQDVPSAPARTNDAGVTRAMVAVLARRARDRRGCPRPRRRSRPVGARSRSCPDRRVGAGVILVRRGSSSNFARARRDPGPTFVGSRRYAGVHRSSPRRGSSPSVGIRIRTRDRVDVWRAKRIQLSHEPRGLHGSLFDAGAPQSPVAPCGNDAEAQARASAVALGRAWPRRRSRERRSALTHTRATFSARSS
jgi:hypothetical protein